MDEPEAKVVNETTTSDRRALRLQKRKNRAFELDFLRGFAICVMLWHHTAYDLRYIFKYDIFGFIDPDGRWFWGMFHPFFLSLFVGISGICCQFSKNNFKRALKVAAVALLFSAVSITADKKLDLGCAVYFNVLHLIALGTFLFAIFDHVEQKKTSSRDSRGGTMFLLMMLLVFFILFKAVPYYDYLFPTPWVNFLGLEPAPGHSLVMGDVIGIVPWLGIFIFGVLIGRMVYPTKETFFPNAPKAVRAISRPFEWIGRHSLIIYLLHQPVILGGLYFLQYLGVVK